MVLESVLWINREGQVDREERKRLTKGGSAGISAKGQGRDKGVLQAVHLGAGDPKEDWAFRRFMDMVPFWGVAVHLG